VLCTPGPNFTSTLVVTQGFRLITDMVKPRSRVSLLWVVGWLTFFLSAVLDNLTTTIIMVSLLQKLCPDPGAACCSSSRKVSGLTPTDVASHTDHGHEVPLGFYTMLYFAFFTIPTWFVFGEQRVLACSVFH
jgi:hypothetical protein